MSNWINQLRNKLFKLGSNSRVIPWVDVIGCCRLEIELSRSSTYDWSRFGVIDVAQDPMEADTMIVGGWINSSRAEYLKRVYSRLNGDKRVIAVGSCALDGQLFASPQNKMISVTEVLPVDIFIPGCPPRPEVVVDGIIKLMSTSNQEGKKSNISDVLVKRGEE